MRLGKISPAGRVATIYPKEDDVDKGRLYGEAAALVDAQASVSGPLRARRAVAVRNQCEEADKGRTYSHARHGAARVVHPASVSIIPKISVMRELERNPDMWQLLAPMLRRRTRALGKRLPRRASDLVSTCDLGGSLGPGDPFPSVPFSELLQVEGHRYMMVYAFFGKFFSRPYSS